MLVDFSVYYTKRCNFALVKLKDVRQPWGLTHTFDFVRAYVCTRKK